MRGWRVRVRQGGLVMALLVALAGFQSGHSGAVFAQAPATPDLTELASSRVSQAQATRLTREASRGSQYGVSINDGAASTPSLDVTLTMIPLPGAVRMQISNSSDLAGSAWEPLASHKTWRLAPPGPSGAPVTVYVQFGNSTGDVSAIYQDQIIVGPAPRTSSVTTTSTSPVTTAATSPVSTPSTVGTSVAAPDCSPRPRISVRTEVALGIPEAGGAMQVTIATSGSNNGLRAVRFDSFSNAIVHAGDQSNQTAPFAVSLPPAQEPTTLRFFVQRQTPGQATTVRLAIVDGCGKWSTFVGGGPNAF